MYSTDFIGLIPNLINKDVVLSLATRVAVNNAINENPNTIIPGVAIATALMPPLCACGYAITTLKGHMILGSAYMFLVNVYFIALGSCIVLSLFNIPRDEEMTEEEWAKGRKAMTVNTIIMIIPAILVSLYRFLH